MVFWQSVRSVSEAEHTLQHKLFVRVQGKLRHKTTSKCQCSANSVLQCVGNWQDVDRFSKIHLCFLDDQLTGDKGTYIVTYKDSPLFTNKGNTYTTSLSLRNNPDQICVTVDTAFYTCTKSISLRNSPDQMCVNVDTALFFQTPAECYVIDDTQRTGCDRYSMT